MMKRSFPRLLCCVVLVGLTACGSDRSETDVFDALKGLAAGLASPLTGSKASAPRGLGMTRATLATIDAPVNIVTIENRGAQGLIVQTGTNRGVETWSSADRKTLSWRNGVLVATRGLGGDLMSAAVPTATQLRSGQAFTRRYVVLDGADQPMTLVYDCRGTGNSAESITVVERSYATQRVTEQCNGPNGSFSNDFWFETGGKLRRSRQFVSESVGFVVIEHLH